jgi:hypothetical protein
MKIVKDGKAGRMLRTAVEREDPLHSLQAFFFSCPSGSQLFHGARLRRSLEHEDREGREGRKNVAHSRRARRPPSTPLRPSFFHVLQVHSFSTEPGYGEALNMKIVKDGKA